MGFGGDELVKQHAETVDVALDRVGFSGEIFGRAVGRGAGAVFDFRAREANVYRLSQVSENIIEASWQAIIDAFEWYLLECKV